MIDAGIPRVDSPVALSQELADIVIRGTQLGFSSWRIATSLGISTRELERIEGHSQQISVRDGLGTGERKPDSGSLD